MKAHTSRTVLVYLIPDRRIEDDSLLVEPRVCEKPQYLLRDLESQEQRKKWAESKEARTAEKETRRPEH